MAAPVTRDWMDMEVVSATNLRNSINGPINYAIGRELGSDSEIEIEDAMRILSGTTGNRFWGVPVGTTGQRPTRAAGLVRFNTSLDNLDIGGGAAWITPLTQEAVTAANLIANGDVGAGTAQVAAGVHGHAGNIGGLFNVDSIGSQNFTGLGTSYLTIAIASVPLSEPADIGIYLRLAIQLNSERSYQGRVRSGELNVISPFTISEQSSPDSLAVSARFGSVVLGAGSHIFNLEIRVNQNSTANAGYSYQMSAMAARAI